MKKSPLLKLTIILYIIFGVGTVALMFIIYKDMDSPFIFNFVMGYLIFLFIFIVYAITITILRMKNLKWLDIRKRLLNFLFWFISLVTVNYILNFVFNLPSKGLWGDLPVPLGLAMGLAFLDLLFVRD